jgi:hypothetical protein
MAAVEYLEKLGMERVAEHEAALAARPSSSWEPSPA